MIRIAATSKNHPQSNTCLSQLTTPTALRIMMDNILLPGLALIDNMETAVRVCIHTTNICVLYHLCSVLVFGYTYIHLVAIYTV